MHKSLPFLIILLVVHLPVFAKTDCKQISTLAENEQAIFSPVASYEVMGKGRLYFHTAPDKDCIDKNVFVIPGDSLIAYTEYQGWFSVMYINPKTGKDYQGWVESNRLKFVGTMGATH